MKTRTIVITYPPEYDGELHITCTEKKEPRARTPDYEYTFTHAAKGSDWETLVAAAKAIIAQNERYLKYQEIRSSKSHRVFNPRHSVSNGDPRPSGR